MRRGRPVVPASPPTSRRGRRSGRLVLLGALTACALSVAGVSGASAATHPVKPSAKSFLLKGSATTGIGVKAFADTGSGSGVDAGEAQSVQLRGEFQQSITAAPALQAPAAGL